VSVFQPDTPDFCQRIDIGTLGVTGGCYIGNYRVNYDIVSTILAWLTAGMRSAYMMRIFPGHMGSVNALHQGGEIPPRK